MMKKQEEKKIIFNQWLNSDHSPSPFYHSMQLTMTWYLQLFAPEELKTSRIFVSMSWENNIFQLSANKRIRWQKIWTWVMKKNKTFWRNLKNNLSEFWGSKTFYTTTKMFGWKGILFFATLKTLLSLKTNNSREDFFSSEKLRKKMKKTRLK